MDKLYDPKHSFKMIKNGIAHLLIILLFINSSFAHESSGQEILDQRISIDFTNENLKSVLSKIEKSSKINFSFNPKEINLDQKVSIEAKNEKIRDIFIRLFTPLKISYELSGVKQVLLFKGGIGLINNTPQIQEIEKPQMASLTIKGLVKDQLDEPMIGVTVKLKGTTIGTITDAKGQYSIEVPSESSALIFSFVGYLPQEINVGNRTSINIIMTPEEKTLGEIVVVGYGTKEKVNLTGAVGVASGKVLQNRPISTVGEGLQGVIPNLNVTVRNGDPTAAVTFNIRGYESINGGSPLILVDGVPMDLNRINPNDIKSISVLKDAAAAAVYGARAAFGVVLVETKKGETGKITVTFGNQISRSTSIFNTDLETDPYQFVLAQNLASTRNGGTPTWDADFVAGTKAYSENPTTAPQWKVLGGVIRYYGQNNYQDRVLRDYSPSNQHDLSIAGGSDKARMYASIGYINKDGFFAIGNDKFKRYNILLKGDFKVNKWLSLDEKVVFNSQNSDKTHVYTQDVSVNSIIRVEPFRLIDFPDLPFYVTPGDRDTYAPYIGKYFTGLNALPYLQDGGRTTFTNNDLWFTQGITLTPVKGLKIRGDFSYNIFKRGYQDVANKVETVNSNLLDPNRTQFGYSGDDYIANEDSTTNYSVLNAYAEYTIPNLRNHSLSVMVGFNQEEGTNRLVRAQNRGLISTSVTDLSATTGTQQATGAKSQVALRGVFYRLNYDYKKKYLLELNGRYDGSSRFPQDSRFGFFPSFSGAWRVSNEDFMASTSHWLTNLKLRASYGTLGNQLLGRNYYPYISTLGAATSQFIFASTAAPTITPAGLVSPTLTWETVTSQNFGLDFTLFKGKLDASFDIYTRDTKNMLLDVSYPDILGTRAPKENGADLRTKGWELALTWRDKIGEDWSYDATFALSDWTAKITKYNNPSGNITSLINNTNNPNTNNYYVGQTLGEIWGFETVGIFQSEAEVTNAPIQTAIGNNWRPGDMQYRDLDGNGKIDNGNGTLSNPGDRKIIGNSNPRYTFGINTSVAYKNIRLTAFFQGIGKIDYLPSNTNYTWFYPFQSNYVEKFFMKESWSETNRDAYFPAPELLGKKNIQAQTRYLQNASYIRLKNITLSYDLPTKLLEKLKIGSVQVYATGMNLWEYSTIRKPLDPETIRTGNVEYPMQRITTLGFNVSF
jgi:TonB-linked SusC/RagA family outer membrane protein